MTAKAALSILFECEPDARFEIDHLEAEFSGEIGALLESRFLVEATPANHVTCFDCGEAHEVSVTCDASGQFVRFCADGGGWTNVAAASLQRYRFNHDALFLVLANALGAGKPEELVPGVCWRLGTGRISGVEYLPVVARGMGDPRRLMEVAQELRQFRKWKGVVICADRPRVGQGWLPRGLITQSLDDVIAFSSAGQLDVDSVALEEALNLRRVGRGAHGLSRDHPDLVALIDKRHRTGESLAAASDEARRLLADPKWKRRGRQAPRQDTLIRFIKRRWTILDRTN